MWIDCKRELPTQGKSVMCCLKDGEVHEGRFLKNANKYVKNVNRWKIYKTGKYVDFEEVVMWRELPVVGIVGVSANA